MSYTHRASIQKLTWSVIQIDTNPYDGRSYLCGCNPHPSRPDRSFHLCEYHDGFDDGVAAAASGEAP